MRSPPGYALPLCIATHLLLAALVFPSGDVLTDSPLLRDDYANKFWLAETRSSLLLSGQLVGYDPELLAGFPVSSIFPSGGPALDLFVTAGARTLGYGRSFNVAAVAFTLAAWPMLILAARALRPGLGRWAAIVALPVCWSGLPLSFVLTGGTSWLWASALVPLCSLLTVRVLRDGWSAAQLAIAAAVVCAVPMIHVATVPVVMLVVALAGLQGWRLAGGRSFVALAVLVVASALANTFWLLPFVQRRADSAGFGGGTTGIFDPWINLVAFFHPNGIVAVAMLLGLAILGLRAARDTEIPPADRSVLGWLVVVPLVIAFVGYGFQLTLALEPYRYMLPALFALVLPAAVALAWAPSPAAALAARVLPVGAPVLALLLVGAAPFVDDTRVRGRAEPGLVALLDLMRAELGPEHRLLIEDSDWAEPEGTWRENLGRPERYFGSHLPVLLPRWTGAESLNGLYSSPFLVHQWLRFQSGQIDGRPMEQWSSDELAELLARHGVTHLLVWSIEAQDRLGRMRARIESVGATDRFELFRVRTPTGRFLVGAGRVRRGSDRLVLSELEPEGGVVVLRYHFDEALRGLPEVTIEAHPVPGDPVGYLRLVDPPSDLVLAFRPEAPEPLRWAPPEGTP